MDETYKIDGHPSARLLFEGKVKKDELYLSSLYGSHNSKIPSFICEGDTLILSCPWCKASLMSTRICEKCNAHMVLMDIEDGGNIQICSRKGCKKHILEFEDLGTELKAFYNVYSTFFKGD
jgi:hypothetical protein